jgi:DNA-binding FrmR family transcriptional regulator
MVENDRDCFEVLKQISATNGAIHSLGMFILEDHLKGCVSETLRDKAKHDALINQVMDIFNRLSR